MVKPAQLRAVAADDIERAVDHYLDKAGADVAARFVDSLEERWAGWPDSRRSGQLRFGYELGIPDLRTWP
ncbi:MAG: hypothetical protein R2715_02730 [Ilumatobacteraceae bacterium]